MDIIIIICFSLPRGPIMSAVRSIVQQVHLYRLQSLVPRNQFDSTPRKNYMGMVRTNVSNVNVFTDYEFFFIMLAA